MGTSSTTDSYHASYASDEAESNFLRRDRYLRVVRLGLAVLIFTLGVSIIGCEGAPLHHYRQTSVYEQAWLPLWPLNLDPHSNIKHLNLLASGTSLAGFLAALMTIIFTIYQPNSPQPNGFTSSETLSSWTCKWKTVRGNPSAIPAAAHFGRDCAASRAGLFLLGVLLGLEVVKGVVAAVGVWCGWRVARQRGAQLTQAKIELVGKYPGV
ncbi:hypothetical protein BDW42DRAFT_189905 [Aspergillus taichungensis]|uniref:Uncharacterized protein n=1 Tax=Aspergillus taichungensis TaxID=482145 RepID=A0A2J5I9B3_9EURO|nr:hypothetical protein BDW42DRAFT_189905 [Aspergillus taichungensis]